MSRDNTGFEDDVLWVVEQALKKIPKPYGPDVIEDVWVEIENRQNLMQNYKLLCATRGQDTVNRAVGHLTRVVTGYKDGNSVPTTRTSLAKTYTILIPHKS